MKIWENKKKQEKVQASIPSASVGCMDKLDALTYEGEGANKEICFRGNFCFLFLIGV